MNVLIVNSPFKSIPVESTGAIERTVFHIVKQFSRLNKRNLNIYLLTRVKTKKFLSVKRDFPNVRIISLPEYDIKYIDSPIYVSEGLFKYMEDLVRIRGMLLRLLKKKEIHIVHFHEPMSAFLFLQLFKRYDLPQRILTLHNFPMLYYIINSKLFPVKYKLWKSLFLPIEKILYKCVTHVSVVNPIFSSYLSIYSPAIRVYYSPLGVDTNLFHPNKRNSSIGNRILKKLNLEKFKGKYVLYVGRVEYLKGVDLLVSVANKLSRKIPFVIVGSGTYLKNMLSIVKKSRRAGQFYFLGSINWRFLPYIYASACCLILPSRAEGFPQVILEAMASGIPVITTEVVKYLGIIKQNENGIIVRTNDINGLAEAITYVVENEKIRKKMGECARKKVVKEYTWEHVAERFLRLYRKILNN